MHEWGPRQLHKNHKGQPIPAKTDTGLTASDRATEGEGCFPKTAKPLAVVPPVCPSCHRSVPYEMLWSPVVPVVPLWCSWCHAGASELPAWGCGVCGLCGPMKVMNVNCAGRHRSQPDGPHRSAYTAVYIRGVTDGRARLRTDPDRQAPSRRSKCQIDTLIIATPCYTTPYTDQKDKMSC